MSEAFHSVAVRLRCTFSFVRSPQVATLSEALTWGLDLRTFPDDIKLAVWGRQGHRCKVCGQEFDFEFMEGDHITPWCDSGRTVIENCLMLCRDCNRRKGAR